MPVGSLACDGSEGEVKKNLFNDVINDNADSATCTLITTLLVNIQEFRYESQNLLDFHLLRQTLNLRDIHRFNLTMGSDDIVAFWCQLHNSWASVCSIFDCLPSFRALLASLIKSLACMLAAVLSSMISLCAVPNDGPDIWVMFRSIDLR